MKRPAYRGIMDVRITVMHSKGRRMGIEPVPPWTYKSVMVTNRVQFSIYALLKMAG